MFRFINKISSKTFQFYSSNNKKSHKNIGQFLKIKEQKHNNAGTYQENSIYDLSNAPKLLLYSQFFPAAIIALPIIYYIGDPISLEYLSSCNLLQYYCSGLLFFNSFFIRENKKKVFPILLSVAVANCISGPYGLITPFILALTNFYIPFTDEKYHQTQNPQNQQNIRLYMKVQGLFYFMLIVLVTIKSYHFISIRQIQVKLKKYQLQNRMFIEKQNIQ